jgi:hypothetical protein
MPEKENFIRILLRRLSIMKSFMVSSFKVAGSEPYLHNKIINKVLLLGCLLNILMWIYLFMNHVSSAYPVILHYNLFFGVDEVGEYDKIFILPGIGLVLLLINTLLANFFYRIERIAAYLLTFNTFILQALLLLASYLVIKVNS